MTGSGRPADSAWSVRYQGALSSWLFSESPEEWKFDVVEAWIRRRELEGPPADGQPVLDLYQVMIRPASVIVTYLVNEDERLIVVKEFY